jgi:stearoyl-CoA desaturase (delta-9 desaturase)
MTKAGRIVNNRRLQRVQHVHSAVAAIAGAGGTLTAITLATRQPIAPASPLLFVAGFLLVGFGLTIGFHRYFTHRSFKTGRLLRGTLAILGSMAAQGPVVFWVSLHRLHHEFADREGDPHSPNLSGTSRWARIRGLAHAYIGWTIEHEVPNSNFYARDLLTDPLVMTINRLYYVWVALGLAVPAALGFVITGGGRGALEGLLWGGLVRMWALHNIIWWITSFAHAIGTRDYVSKDLSTNNLWIALPTLGESWHNNHHTFPQAAVLSFRWWQIDPSGLLIGALERLGLVWDAYRPSAREIEARRVPDGMDVEHERRGYQS